MRGLTAKRLLSITLAAASLAMLAAVKPAAASTLRISAGSAQRAANEVEADYTTSHVLISETAHESVPITVFFDPQVTGSKRPKCSPTSIAETGRRPTPMAMASKKESVRHPATASLQETIATITRLIR
jgi:hypothetical protein